MAQSRNRFRYQDMEKMMTMVLIADAAVMVTCLVAAGMGITWLKVTAAIIAILVSVLCLAYLYLTQELLRQRSLWMSVGFAAVVVVLAASLLLNFPSPSGKTPDNSGDQGDAPAVGAITAFIE